MALLVDISVVALCVCKLKSTTETTAEKVKSATHAMSMI